MTAGRATGIDRPGLQVSSYVALGDSFTAGTGTDAGLCWADRVARALGCTGYRNLAEHGATSAEVRKQVRDALQLEPDLVTVICGVNDLIFDSRLDLVAYSRNFSAMLRELQDVLPGVRLMTATSPERWDFLPVGPRTRARIERDAKRLNMATRNLAQSNGVVLLDVATAPGLGEAENFDSDGLHPSPLGHQRAAEAIGALLSERFHLQIDQEALR